MKMVMPEKRFWLSSMMISVFCLFAFTVCVSQTNIKEANISADKAYEFYEKGDWSKALKKIRNLSERSPYNDDLHYVLGDIYYHLGDFKRSIASFEKNVDLGAANGLSYTYLALSKAYIKDDNQSKALDFLLKAFHTNIELKVRIERDSLFTNLRKTKEYRQLVTGKILEPGYSKAQAWRADLKYLVNLLQRTHISPFARTSKGDWDQIVSKVNKSIPKLSDFEIVAEFQRIAALPGDGHTAVYNPRLPAHKNSGFHHLPIMLYYFGDKLYVRAAAPKYKDLVGKRVVKIGGKNIAEIENNLWKHHHGYDNKMQFYWMAPWYMVIPEILKYYGATNSLGEAKFTVASERGLETISVVTDQLLTKSYQKSTAPSDWINMRVETSESTPLYLRDPDNSFWYTHVKDKNVIYFQVNKVRNKKNQRLADYAKMVFNEAGKHKARAVILDIRLNNGGNTRLGMQLVKAIIASQMDKRGKLFVITSRNTFSAAMNLSSTLEKWTNAIFVGEPTGSSPNFTGEEKNVKLPYSGLSISISDRKWVGGLDSQDSRKWVAPELGASLTAAQYKNNIDPSFEVIMKYLDDQHKNP